MSEENRTEVEKVHQALEGLLDRLAKRVAERLDRSKRVRQPTVPNHPKPAEDEMKMSESI